jgi:transporter family protein
MSDVPETRSGWLLYALGSAIFAALTALLSKVGVSEINSNLASLIRTAIILLMTVGIVAFRSEWEPLQKLSTRGLVVLIFSGLATGLSWLCYFRALQMAPASRVAPIDKLSVALVIVFAVVCLGEPLTWKVALGGSLIVAGAVILAT